MLFVFGWNSHIWSCPEWYHDLCPTFLPGAFILCSCGMCGQIIIPDPDLLPLDALPPPMPPLALLPLLALLLKWPGAAGRRGNICRLKVWSRCDPQHLTLGTDAVALVAVKTKTNKKTKTKTNTMTKTNIYILKVWAAGGAANSRDRWKLVRRWNTRLSS